MAMAKYNAVATKKVTTNDTKSIEKYFTFFILFLFLINWIKNNTKPISCNKIINFK